MRYILILLCAFMTLDANFLGNIYAELRALNLSRGQQEQLKNIIKEHHIFLKKWHLDSKEINDKIMERFFNSSLSSDSSEIIKNINLENAKVQAEQKLLISVYDILNNEQRKAFGKKIIERNRRNIANKDRLDDSHKIYKQEFESSIFEDDFKKNTYQESDDKNSMINHIRKIMIR